MRARYYNPYICRFINADPSGLYRRSQLHYAFANGDPISKLDPFGLTELYRGPNTDDPLLKLTRRQQVVSSPRPHGSIYHNSSGAGPYDFGWNGQAADTFKVNGQKLSADQFGNFIAGFQGQAYDNGPYPVPYSTLSTVEMAGIGYHLIGQTKAVNDPLPDNTGLPYVNAGAEYAKTFLSDPVPANTPATPTTPTTGQGNIYVVK